MQLIGRAVAVVAVIVVGIASIISTGGDGDAPAGGGPDTTAPTVSSSTPADDSSGVARDTIVTATFSEAIDPNSIDTSSFMLRDAQGAIIPAGVSLNMNTNTATLTPNQTLRLLTRYTATLSTGITDVAGNALAAAISWSFTVVDRQWGTAELIETNDGDAAPEVHVAMNANGDALAVWSQWGGTPSNKIWSNRYTAGEGWGTAEPIETDEAGGGSPRIGIDADGNAMAVWLKGSVWFNRYTAGVGWGTAELIDTDDAGEASSADIVINANGNALATWSRWDGSRHNIWSNRYTVGSGWGTAERIQTDDKGNSGGARIAINANGNAVAVWQPWTDVGDSEIWSNLYTVGSGWGAAELLDTGRAHSPHVAIDADGNAHAVWTQLDGTPYNIWSNRYTAGAGWGTAEPIDTDEAGGGGARIGIDADGNAMAVWLGGSGPCFQICFNRYTAGEGWGAAEPIEPGYAVVGVGKLEVAFNANGNAVAVWLQRWNGGKIVASNRYTPGVGWGTAEPLETDYDGFARGRPQVAIDADGNALAVWWQWDGSRGNIWSNRLE